MNGQHRGHEKATWWQVVASYPCPYCGATSGERCTSPDSGKTCDTPHAARARKASSRGWRYAEEEP